VKNLSNFFLAKCFEILNVHSSVIKQLTAMNVAPLDSSRPGASFEIKIFEKFAKKIKFLFSKIFGSKEAACREESNGAKFIALSRLITELWPFEISKL
jgi:hypothetical protein